MDNNVIVKLENISAGYDTHEVIHGASFPILRHDFMGIIGPNGGGKTTLIKTILGLLHPMKGNISFFREGQHTPSLRIGYLPQYTTFDKKFPISVRDVVLSGLHGKHFVWHRFDSADQQKADDIIHLLDLDNCAGNAIGEISGGQRQRALIGRALVCDPEILILDEPNTYIDKKNQDKLYELLKRVNTHCAILLVSHDIGTVLRNVRNIVCVNHNVHYHPVNEVDEKILEESFGCPFQLVAHGQIPHRILENHTN